LQQGKTLHSFGLFVELFLLPSLLYSKERNPTFFTMALHQFDYLLAIGTIFAFLDAWNIGANDAANSWASSVSSRSLTYIQAMVLGAILEFAGAVGVGGRVADTIRTKVVSVDAFENSSPFSCWVWSVLSLLPLCTSLSLPKSACLCPLLTLSLEVFWVWVLVLLVAVVLFGLAITMMDRWILRLVLFRFVPIPIN
jgi:hypothetical protein